MAWLVALSAQGQTLNLPARSANAPNGTQFNNIITSLSRDERERWIYAQVISGNVPGWLRTLKPVTVSAAGHTATYHVTPDYLAVGSDTNYFLCPMTPVLAQRLGDRLGGTLPTRKMANQIWANAPVKLTPHPFSPDTFDIMSLEVFAESNQTIRFQRDAQTNAYPLGALVSGDKKDVVISNEIANRPPPPRVVIYGWHYPNGTVIQGLSAVHEETYMDYSHGIRLIRMNLTVNGGPNTVTNVLTSPSFAVLLSDETTSLNNTIPLPRYTVAPLAPAVMTHPRSRTVTVGDTILLHTLAIGDAPLAYHWRMHGTNLPAATNASLVITNAQPSDAGPCTVVVGNATGSVTSRVAVVRVNPVPPPVLFADDFDTNTAANWNVFWGAANGIPDYTVDWAFDYGAIPCTFNGVTALIPPAPNSPDGSTRALRLTVNNNDATAAIAAVNLYPNGRQFAGDFALKFDLWINYPGHAGGTGTGVAGSTEHAIFGVNHLGTNANWAAPAAAASDGLWFAASGEGGDSRDYRAYVGNLTGTSIDLSATLAATNHTAAFFQNLFPPARFETTGAPGKNWIEAEVRYATNAITWLLDGAVVGQRTNTSVFTNGTVMIGLMDTFNSIASPARDSLVLFDNLRVEDLTPYPLRFESVAQLTNGWVQLLLRGVPGRSYALQTAAALPPVNWQTLVTITASNTPVAFVDTNAPASPARFYRLRQ